MAKNKPIKVRLKRKKVVKSKRELRKKPIKSKINLGPKSARRKIDPATGKVLSRRAFEKKYGRKTKKETHKYKSWLHKYNIYKQIRIDYVEKLKHDKKFTTNQDAINSPELKKILKDLHSKDARVKAEALALTGRITEDQIELYVEKFEEQSK